MFDYSKLDGKIVERFGTRYKFAGAMKMSCCTLSKKMAGKVSWNQDEMYHASKLLNFELSEIPTYFFAAEVKQT